MKLDPKLSVKPIAFKVLTLLNRKLVRLNRELGQKALMAETAAWYNGRERGISLTITPETYRGKNRNLVIVWSECRNSDSVVVYVWQSDCGLNPPVVGDLTDEAYRAGRYFNPDGRAATRHIYSLIVAYLKQLEERPKEAV